MPISRDLAPSTLDASLLDADDAGSDATLAAGPIRLDKKDLTLPTFKGRILDSDDEIENMVPPDVAIGKASKKNKVAISSEVEEKSDPVEYLQVGQKPFQSGRITRASALANGIEAIVVSAAREKFSLSDNKSTTDAPFTDSKRACRVVSGEKGITNAQESSVKPSIRVQRMATPPLTDTPMPYSNDSHIRLDSDKAQSLYEFRPAEVSKRSAALATSKTDLNSHDDLPQANTNIKTDRQSSTQAPLNGLHFALAPSFSLKSINALSACSLTISC